MSKIWAQKNPVDDRIYHLMRLLDNENWWRRGESHPGPDMMCMNGQLQAYSISLLRRNGAVTDRTAVISIRAVPLTLPALIGPCEYASALPRSGGCLIKQPVRNCCRFFFVTGNACRSACFQTSTIPVEPDRPQIVCR